MIDYKFNEDKLMFELKNHIDNSYDGHYSKDRNFQASEFIFDSGLGIGFTLGNSLKYIQRYGHKGDGPDDYRKDLIKAAHYIILALNCHDEKYKETETDYDTIRTDD